MSALVKSIRLRREQDALTWLQALWSFVSLRPRIARRILISSGEDGFSSELVCAVASWYRGANRLSLTHAAAEVLRICRTPSWWSTDDGHRYIFAWLEAERVASTLGHHSYGQLEREIDEAISTRSLVRGIASLIALSVHPAFSNSAVIEQLSTWTERIGQPRSVALCDCWRSVAPVLGRDGNIVGLLLYQLLGGTVPPVAVPEIDSSDVQLTAHRPVNPPPWANDGIHAKGDGPFDSRFAGVLPRMAQMCHAYSVLGRLDPADEWPSEIERATACSSQPPPSA